MIKSGIKKTIGALLRAARATRIGRLVHQQMIDATFADTATVRHKGVEIALTVPNWIARYRADTFATKEPETLEWVEQLAQGAVLWDVGANVGLYAIYAAKARGCRVFAFEPSVFNLELLARNVSLNQLQQRVTIVPIPLSDGLGVNTFQMSTTSWGGALSTFAHGLDQDGATLKAIFEYSLVGLSMDQARDRLEVPQPAYLKIDVDGIEHLILAAGPSVLSSVDSVLVEINDAFEEQSRGVQQSLAAAGLTLYRKSDAGAPGVFNQWWRRESPAREGVI